MSMPRHFQLDLQKLKTGDKDTILAFASYLIPRIQVSLAELPITQDDMFEIAQDLIARIATNPEHFAALGSQEKIVEYCSKLARNAVVHRQRSVQRETIVDASSEIVQSQSDALDISKLDAELMRQAIEQLPETQQHVIYFTFVAGLTSLETAKELNISLGSVKALRYRAINRLRELLIDVVEEHEQ